MTALRKLLALFTRSEKLKLIPLTMAVLFTSVLGVAGVGSLGPFVAVISDPGVIETQPILAFAYEFGGFESTQSFLVALGIGVFAVVAVATLFRMATLYVLFRYVGNRRHHLSMRLFRQYLYQPYSYYLDHNTSELSKNLLAEVNQVVNGVLRPAMEMFAHGTMGLAILVFLLVLNPLVGLAAGVIFGVSYGVLYGIVRPLLNYYGHELRESNRLRFKATGEAFGAIKDVKILGKEPAFAQKFSVGSRRFATTQAAKQIIAQVPFEAMQAIAIGFAVALVLFMLTAGGVISDVLPLLAVYAFAVQRILPEIKKVFSGVTQIRYYSETVDALHRDMTEMPPPPAISDKKAAQEPPDPMPFEREISLRDVSFHYPTSKAAVLENISLKIPKNTTVGFVGTTGCGKTTLVDVIMGLLPPRSGALLVDGVPVGEDGASVAKWEQNFGYVPQQIFISDDSVAANIAFGMSEKLVDSGRIEHAARVANLHDFVVTELPEGYDTHVGERGVRLSGGQRQRIGIASAGVP